MMMLLFFALTLFGAMAAPASSPSDSLTAAQEEETYYRIETVPIPEGVSLEVGGLALLPDGSIGAATRRGEVWHIQNPYMEGGTLPHYRRFAHGLHEALGLAYRDGFWYTTQRGELTRLRDVDKDGRADEYHTVYRWPLEGNYHEYSYGPVIRKNGNMLVTLNLAWIGYGASLSKWRGWVLEITPDGEMTPIATGMRSPAGFGLNVEGDLFFAENQGDWVGSGFIAHVEKGDFLGNPAGLKWTGEPGSPLSLKPEDVPNTGDPRHVVAESVPELKNPAVWFPHTLMGISTSAILADTTGGAFGPFTGQLFVGDQGHSTVMRASLEKVKGVYQGACFPFRSGFSSGVLRTIWGKDGSMFVGMTNRGWGSTGKAPFGLQRLSWTGRTPFEIQTIHAQPDGFELTLTQPVDHKTAVEGASYEITGFTYQYHNTYGSPITNQEALTLKGVHVSEDGLKIRLAVEGLREGYIHEIKASGLKNTSGLSLLHDTAYYTMNRIPDGEAMPNAGMLKTAAAEKEIVAPPKRIAQFSSMSKRVTELPEDWQGEAVQTVVMGTLPGLRFNLEDFEVKAGSKVRFVFNNNDDMMHNLLVVKPGQADAVADAAMQLGLDGVAKDYVPAMEAVLYHTSLLQPEASETIYFVAPDEPGAYIFVCTFPGHALTMRGIMRVTA